jgi:hypothetical protein
MTFGRMTEGLGIPMRPSVVLRAGPAYINQWAYGRPQKARTRFRLVR